VSGEVVEDLARGLVAEASQSGSIVVGDEAEDEGVALGGVVEAVAAAVGLGAGMGLQGFGLATAGPRPLIN
jgi:hypothetical protein